MTELVFLIGGFGMGLVAGLLFAPSRNKSDLSMGAHPLPCFLFKPDMSRDEQVLCLREMANELEARPAQKEGRDDA